MMTTLSAHDLVIDIPTRKDGSPISLEIRPGQIWGVLGPNGAGKTTLLHTLAGLRPARRGGIRLDGTSMDRIPRRQVARQLAVVFQDHHDSFPATVLETALIGRHPHLSPWDLDTSTDRAIARDALQTMELAGMEHRLVNTLSGGERQRLAIATALTQRPRLWLADEPTNHLDLRHQVGIMRFMASQARDGRAVFMCLHDLNLAARWCDHVMLLQPDGEFCWGPARTMLVPEALEKLYGQALAVATVNGAPVFVPADTRSPSENNRREQP